MLDLLRERGGSNIRVYGGGGGVIVPSEIEDLHGYGVARIFSPEDGQKMGLQGMIGLMVAECDHDLRQGAPASLDALKDNDLTKRWRALAQLDHRAGTQRGRRQAASSRFTSRPTPRRCRCSASPAPAAPASRA